MHSHPSLLPSCLPAALAAVASSRAWIAVVCILFCLCCLLVCLVLGDSFSRPRVGGLLSWVPPRSRFTRALDLVCLRMPSVSFDVFLLAFDVCLFAFVRVANSSLSVYAKLDSIM